MFHNTELMAYTRDFSHRRIYSNSKQTTYFFQFRCACSTSLFLAYSYRCLAYINNWKKSICSHSRLPHFPLLTFPSSRPKPISTLRFTTTEIEPFFTNMPSFSSIRFRIPPENLFIWFSFCRTDSVPGGYTHHTDFFLIQQSSYIDGMQKKRALTHSPCSSYIAKRRNLPLRKKNEIMTFCGNK